MPSKQPAGQASRWDGVFATHRDVGLAQTMTPNQFDEIVRYTLAERSDAAPFDVIMEGASEGSADDASRIATYGDLGLTWWIEQLTWVRGSVDDVRSRIEQGPPR